MLKKQKNSDEAENKSSERTVVISPPKFQFISIPIRGTAPLVLFRFDKKAEEQMRADQEQGQSAKSKKKRDPKNFDELYKRAFYVSDENWFGFKASAVRKAMISACKIVNYKMTLAKLGVFTEADGYDVEDGSPLIRIRSGQPQKYFCPVRIGMGKPDIRVRPLWKPGWTAMLRIRFDADLFTKTDIVNLIMRVGAQVGIGEGRPDSKDSAGMGFGLFEIITDEKEEKQHGA